MNNVEKILIMGFVMMLGLFALFQVINDTANNTSLDEESNNIIRKYNTQYLEVNDRQIFYAASLNDSEGAQLNHEGVEAFYRSTSEAKGSADKVSDSWKMFAKFPLMLISSMPFIELNTEILYLVGLFIGIITILGFLAIFKMWFGGNTNN